MSHMLPAKPKINPKGVAVKAAKNQTTKWQIKLVLRKLKKQFGKKFHTHLYTSLDLINDKTLEKLYKAGLDEIRFHLDLDNNKLWNKIKLAKKYNLSVNGLKKVLSNETYLGKIKFSGEISNGVHSPLLSEEVFNKVKEKLNNG